jgi:nucleoside-diphosphate-sugar epimerase
MILVTGATGLLGSRLIYDLVTQGRKVRALKRSTSDLSLLKKYFSVNPGLFDQIEWRDGNVLDVYSLLEAMEGVEQVYHCAGYVSLNPADRKKMMKVNIDGTANVVNMSLEAEVQKLCYVSSIAALGRSVTNTIINEETKWETSGNNSVYAESKYYAEREVWRGIAEGLNAVIVNPSVIIGPAGNWKRSSASVFAVAWRGLRFYTEGVNGFVDVRDVSAAMMKLMEGDNKNQNYIVSSENFSYKDLFSEITRCFGLPEPSVKATIWMGELVWRLETLRSRLTGSRPLITRDSVRTAREKYFYSNDKIRTTLGINFIPIRQSIRDVCDVFLKEKQGHLQV